MEPAKLQKREYLTHRLIKICGEEYVKFDRQTVVEYSLNSCGDTVRPMYVVFPHTTEQISQLVQFANEERLTLFPISRGQNFGYGNKQGTSAGQIILDLSLMNRVIAINPELCYATVEAGVSQTQLYQTLQKHPGRPLAMDVTGAGSNASIVGNLLERGFGHTDYGDRFSRIVNMKVVLPNADVIQTGFGCFTHANALHTYRQGLGPVLEGLFSQSNLGIVTEVTIELMPKPEKNCMFIFSTPVENDLPKLVDTLRELRLQNIINSTVHIANKTRTVGDENNRYVGAWNLSGSLSGPASIVNAKKKLIRKAFNTQFKHCKIWFITDRLLRFVQWVDKYITPIDTYPVIKDAFDLMKGIPSDSPIQTLLSQQVDTSEIQVSKLPKHFQWICAVSEASADSLCKMQDITAALFAKHQYEYRVTFTSINPRSFIMIANITYEKTESSMAKAQTFYKECTQVLSEAGFHPYRSGSGKYQYLSPRKKGYQNVLNQLKQCLDPNAILAPGKYNIGIP
ncbi:FAD-binding oxidoreductase [Rapidithrix thailandica]|uniref:FAD-binding oxidoreductase n=1 Tax=Rapidithrix thailandica TaxID=413964 RepID=A0AAW9SED8_9BACT